MKVRAKRAAWDGLRRIKEGEVFDSSRLTLKKDDKGQEILPDWLEPVDKKAKSQIKQPASDGRKNPPNKQVQAAQEKAAQRKPAQGQADDNEAEGAGDAGGDGAGSGE